MAAIISFAETQNDDRDDANTDDSKLELDIRFDGNCVYDFH